MALPLSAKQQVHRLLIKNGFSKVEFRTKPIRVVKSGFDSVQDTDVLTIRWSQISRDDAGKQRQLERMAKVLESAGWQVTLDGVGLHVTRSV